MEPGTMACSRIRRPQEGAVGDAARGEPLAPRLLQALASADAHPSDASRSGGVEWIQTHLSHVFLTRERVYKLRKAIDLGFLDFRTRAERNADCLREVRLNRRLAPELYLDVVPITGTPSRPRLGGEGEPIEYALRMRQFDQNGILERVLARGELTATHEIGRASCRERV